MKALATLLAALSLAAVPASAQQTGADVLIFVDVSKSMNRDGLFRAVRQSLIDLLATLTVNDRLVVYTFGTDVQPAEDVTIGGSRDLAASRRRLGELQADQDWTYLTKAIDVAASRLAELHQLDPTRAKTVYILTDGRNEPPPDVGEEAVTFEDIVRVHGATLAELSSVMYVVRFGTVMQDSEVAQIEGTGMRVIDETRTVNRIRAIPKLIRIAPAEQPLTLQPVGGDPVRAEARFSLSRGPGVRGTISVSLELEPVEGVTVVGPSDFTLSGESAEAVVTMDVNPGVIAVQQRRLAVQARAGPNVRVEPPAVALVLNMAPPPVVSWSAPAKTRYRVLRDSLFADVSLTIESTARESVTVQITLAEGAERWSVAPGTMSVPPGRGEAQAHLSSVTPGGATLVEIALQPVDRVEVEPSKVALQVLPPRSRLPLLLAIAVLLFAAAGGGYIRFGVARFGEDLRLSVVDRSSGVTIDTLALRERQGALRRRLVFARDWDVGGLEDEAFAVAPAGSGILVQPVNVQGKPERHGAVQSAEVFPIEPGDRFEIGETRFRLHSLDQT